MSQETTEISPITLKIHRIDGTPTGESVTLDARVFGLPRNDHVLYLAVKTELTNRRQGTRSTKVKDEVRGGGKKPFRQKGRGAARAGSIRSPLWVGGGKIFGPRPVDFNMQLPRKAKQLARRVAFSVKAQDAAITLVEDIRMDVPKTKTIAAMLNSFGVHDKSALLLVDGHHPNVVKSVRNIPRMEVRSGTDASTFDVLRARHLFISRSALDSIVRGLANGE